MYKVVWKKTASKQLAKIDRTIARKLTNKVENFLAKDPINREERLRYDYKGLYRYRFENYRVIYEVIKSEVVVSVVKVGHRREVYY